MKNYQQNNNNSSLSVEEPFAIYANSTYDDVGIFRLMDAAKRGITYKVFEILSAKFPFTLQDWADFLHISGKTLSRYQKEKKTFDTVQSEKIIQIQLLYTRGEEVFGSSDYFLDWLQTENLILGRIKPQDLLSSNFGIALLMDELTRIEHGILA